MRRCRILVVLAALSVLAVGGCSKSEQPAPNPDRPQVVPDRVIAVPEGFGVIRLITGPYSPEIVSRGFYHLRGPIPLQPFELGLHQYALMDSIANYEVLRYREFDGFESVLDSVPPGRDTLLVYVSRLGRAETKLDTVVSPDGDTTITDPVKSMPPYDYYFRPVLVDSIVVADGQVSTIDLSLSLEKWGRPVQTDAGWEAPRARYLLYSPR